MTMKRAAISIAILSFFLVATNPFGLLLMVLSDSENPSVDIETWEAPREMQKQFPYYIIGLDNKEQPIFVVEFGKWDVRKYFEDGGDEKNALRYIDQFMYRLRKANLNLSNHGNSTETSGRFVVLWDDDGFQTKQLTYDPSVFFMLSIARKFVLGPGELLDYCIVVNVEPAVEIATKNLIFPLVGSLARRYEIHGTNSKTWIPLLLDRIPKESLAPWYGGSLAPFRPLAVFG